MSTKIIEKKMVFTSQIVEEATNRINDGVTLKRFQNPWLNTEVGIRRNGLVFKMTPDEQQEYIKCALDVQYFAEKYCKVKTEDGSINNIKLREYQRDMLDLFANNRNSILMASRQVGKCVSFNTIVRIKRDDTEFDIRIGELYYMCLSKVRKLTLLERIKIKLYNILYQLEG
jgi:hypothetical protein